MPFNYSFRVSEHLIVISFQATFALAEIQNVVMLNVPKAKNTILKSFAINNYDLFTSQVIKKVFLSFCSYEPSYVWEKQM